MGVVFDGMRWLYGVDGEKRVVSRRFLLRRAHVLTCMRGNRRITGSPSRGHGTAVEDTKKNEEWGAMLETRSSKMPEEGEASSLNRIGPIIAGLGIRSCLVASPIGLGE